MLWFLVKRFGWFLLTLWVVFTVTFFLMRSVPGGPFSSERKLDPAVERNIERRYKLDQPLLTQYMSNLWQTMTGDLGPSFRMADFSVNEVIAQGFPISASLGILALLFAVIVGVTAGLMAALWRGSGADVLIMAVATVGIAVPNFVFAGLLILLLVFAFPIFPPAGWGSLEQLILPAICLGLPYAAYIARLTRTGMLEVLGQDYIRTAKAKGLPPWRVVTSHALKGAMLPVVTFLGPATAGVLTGSLVLEQIFAIPGLGSHFVEAALQRDYTLAMGLVLVYTMILYFMNFLVDLSYGWLDPRVKLN